jgi:hypothetical protein
METVLDRACLCTSLCFMFPDSKAPHIEDKWSSLIWIQLDNLDCPCCGPILPFFHTDKSYQPVDMMTNYINRLIQFDKLYQPADIICPCGKMVK